MDSLPVHVLLLTFLTGTQSHPHSAPVTECPTANQTRQCSGANNFVDSFTVGLDPKSWTTEHMDVVCGNKDEFVSYVSCLLSAEKQCVGTDHVDLVAEVSTVHEYHQFACQEKAKVLGSCVTTNNATITECYNNAVALITTAMDEYQCLWEDELTKCYETGYSSCNDDTKHVIDVLLKNRRPIRCGSDITTASFLLTVVAALVGMVNLNTH